MKHTLKRTLLISSLLVFSSSVLTGCFFDMNYEKKEDYYDLFSDSAHLIYANEEGTFSSETVKSIEDELFNDDTANNVNKVDTIKEEYYEYLWIKPTSTVTVEDFALFVKAFETVKFEVRIYLLDVQPIAAGVRSFAMPKTDDDGREILYGDDFSNPINVNLTATKQADWQSVYSNNWNVSGKDSRYFDAGISNYIVVQFLNNTGYGADLGYQPIKFSIVNLMVSPKNEKYAVTTN